MSDEMHRASAQDEQPSDAGLLQEEELESVAGGEFLRCEPPPVIVEPYPIMPGIEPCF